MRCTMTERGVQGEACRSNGVRRAVRAVSNFTALSTPVGCTEDHRSCSSDAESSIRLILG